MKLPRSRLNLNVLLHYNTYILMFEVSLLGFRTADLCYYSAPIQGNIFTRKMESLSFYTTYLNIKAGQLDWAICCNARERSLWARAAMYRNPPSKGAALISASLWSKPCWSKVPPFKTPHSSLSLHSLCLQLEEELQGISKVVICRCVDDWGRGRPHWLEYTWCIFHDLLVLSQITKSLPLGDWHLVESS